MCSTPYTSWFSTVSPAHLSWTSLPLFRSDSSPFNTLQTIVLKTINRALEEIVSMDSIYYVKSNKQWGILYENLKVIVALEFEQIKTFQYRYLQLVKEGQLWYFDPKFNVIIKPKK